jgi:hypothetical protein
MKIKCIKKMRVSSFHPYMYIHPNAYITFLVFLLCVHNRNKGDLGKVQFPFC